MDDRVRDICGARLRGAVALAHCLPGGLRHIHRPQQPHFNLLPDYPQARYRPRCPLESSQLKSAHVRLRILLLPHLGNIQHLGCLITRFYIHITISRLVPIPRLPTTFYNFSWPAACSISASQAAYSKSRLPVASFRDGLWHTFAAGPI